MRDSVCRQRPGLPHECGEWAGHVGPGTSAGHAGGTGLARGGWGITAQHSWSGCRHRPSSHQRPNKSVFDDKFFKMKGRQGKLCINIGELLTLASEKDSTKKKYTFYHKIWAIKGEFCGEECPPKKESQCKGPVLGEPDSLRKPKNVVWLCRSERAKARAPGEAGPARP